MQVVRVNFDQGRKNSQIYINERLETCGVQENLSKAKRVTYGHERWAMNMKRIIEQANMKKKIGDHDLKFVMGIGIQNLVVAYTFTLRWILEHFLRYFGTRCISILGIHKFNASNHTISFIFH